MSTVNKANLALLFELKSLASLILKPTIDEEEIQKASKIFNVSWFLGYLWNTHNVMETKIEKQNRQSQIVQWKGDRNVDQDKFSIFLAENLEICIDLAWYPNSFFGNINIYPPFIAKDSRVTAVGQRKSTTSVRLQHWVKPAVPISTSPLIWFEIKPFHCPVSWSIAPQPPSNRLNWRILKFSILESSLRISWCSPYIRSVT